jgi:hypothetical protein
MSTFWGSTKDGDNDPPLKINGNGGDDGEGLLNAEQPRRSHDGGSTRSVRSRREPSERDRLLGAHRAPRQEAFLDPDDPAVCIPSICIKELT